MKKIWYVFGSAALLCVFGTACSHNNTKNIAGGSPQIQAPVAPPVQTAPTVQQTKGGPPNQTRTLTGGPPVAETAKRLNSQQRADVNQLLARLTDAFFDYNQAEIRSDATSALSQDVGVIRNILSEYPAEKLQIEGHADERGSAEYNLALADRRSRAAQEFLSSRGIPQTQLTVLSYGEERPFCTDQTEACYQQNRRVHITVAP